MITAKKTMTNLERDLIFRVVDGDQNLFVVMHHWHKMINFKASLLWCMNNGLTGKNLTEWLKHSPHDGILNGYGFILGQLRKENKVIQIHYGREYVG